jgi:hypothetical protein
MAHVAAAPTTLDANIIGHSDDVVVAAGGVSASCPKPTTGWPL